MPFTFTPTSLPGLVIVQPRSFPDDRGFFMESYKASEFLQAGISKPFVQDNHSYSSRGVLRGIHFQLPPHAQGKLVRVIDGAVWDVGIDLCRSSSTFGKWFGLELSGTNHSMLYVPPRFGHGFLVLSKTAHISYKCTDEYSKETERSIRYDDPDLSITWPQLPAGQDYLLSDKDAAAPLLWQTEVFP